MREIKFRAFHKPTKRIFPVFSITPQHLFEDTRDGIWTSKTNPAERDECELLQYTGLKDKNGQEIYEGDLAQNESGRICKVDYRVAIAAYDFTPVGNTIGTAALGFRPAMAHMYLEVIGNIYANPELVQP